MKTLLSILLLSLLIVYFLKPIFPFIEYAVDKEYIENILCINKNKPEKNCNGKCHLKNQLKKASEEGPKKNIPIKINSNDLPLILSQLNKLDFKIYPSIIKTGFYINSYFSDFYFTIFHPPKFNLIYN
jgi:hypothetical protein